MHHWCNDDDNDDDNAPKEDENREGEDKDIEPDQVDWTWACQGKA